jgi:hypothetical protein
MTAGRPYKRKKRPGVNRGAAQGLRRLLSAQRESSSGLVKGSLLSAHCRQRAPAHYRNRVNLVERIPQRIPLFERRGQHLRRLVKPGALEQPETFALAHGCSPFALAMARASSSIFSDSSCLIRAKREARSLTAWTIKVAFTFVTAASSQLPVSMAATDATVRLRSSADVMRQVPLAGMRRVVHGVGVGALIPHPLPSPRAPPARRATGRRWRGRRPAIWRALAPSRPRSRVAAPR